VHALIIFVEKKLKICIVCSVHALIHRYRWESVIHGHHIYKAIWMPEIGETLCCEQE